MTLPSGDDVALAAALAVLGTVEVATRDPGPRLVLAVAMLLQTVPLAWRRIAPVTVAAVSLGGVFVELSHGETVADAAGFLSFLVLAYSVARWSNGGRRPIGLSILLIGSVVHEFGSGYTSLGLALIQVLFDAAIVAAAWGVGSLVRRRVQQADAAIDESEALVAEWAERERQIMDDERRRIARELHDVIGHALAGIALSAGAAERSGGAVTPEVRDALVAIRQSSQTAAADVRRLLGLLRESDDLAPLPQASLAAMPALVDRCNRAGLQVELDVEGCARNVAPGLQLAIYRIVQEGLTNVAKHQPSAHVVVRLRWATSSVAVEVVNEGDEAPVAPRREHGHGLVGVRERVALYDGTMTAEALDGGGFRLAARLPLS